MRRGVHSLGWTALAWTLWVSGMSLSAACGSDDEEDEHAHGPDDHHDGGHDGHDMPVGPASGAVCPEGGGTLTYENFGKQFFSDYCLSCHSSSVKGAARMGAPEDHNFDKLSEIDLLIDHVDQKAAKGPASTNLSMPPSGKRPSDEERAKLGEWLACGVPE